MHYKTIPTIVCAFIVIFIPLDDWECFTNSKSIWCIICNHFISCLEVISLWGLVMAIEFTFTPIDYTFFGTLKSFSTSILCISCKIAHSLCLCIVFILARIIVTKHLFSHISLRQFYAFICSYRAINAFHYLRWDVFEAHGQTIPMPCLCLPYSTCMFTRVAATTISYTIPLSFTL